MGYTFAPQNAATENGNAVELPVIRPLITLSMKTADTIPSRRGLRLPNLLDLPIPMKL